MSRKTLLGILAVIGAVLTFFKDQFGLNIDPTAMIAGISAVLLYILFEAKLDILRIKLQSSKWKDKKFWLAFISALLTALESAFHWGIPVEIIVSALTVIMGILFKKGYNTVKNE